MPGKKRPWQRGKPADRAATCHGKLPPLREGFAIPSHSAGSPPLRGDPAGPSQASEGGGPRPYARGSSAEALAYIANPSLCSSALKKDICAATTAGPNESRRQLWSDLATRAGYSDPFHLRPEMVYEVMGALKLAGFRSAQLYLDTAKAQHVSLGHTWSDQLQQCYRAAVRSCLRNIGSPKQASPLPLAELTALGGSEAVVNNGPIWPARSALLASWWLLREIEASHAVREHIEVDEGNRRISWRLPSSKTDWKALGATRCHSCSCEFAPPEQCPYHCMVAHLAAIGQRPGAPHLPGYRREPRLKSRLGRHLSMAGCLFGATNYPRQRRQMLYGAHGQSHRRSSPGRQPGRDVANPTLRQMGLSSISSVCQGGTAQAAGQAGAGNVGAHIHRRGKVQVGRPSAPSPTWFSIGSGVSVFTHDPGL